jgi:hypothetical protein
MPPNAHQPPSAGQIDPSSPMSDPPSVLVAPSTDSDDDSSSTQTPDTPSRMRYSSLDPAGEDSDDLDSDLNDPTATTTTYLSRKQKLDTIVRALRRTKWSFEDMVLAWVGTSGSQDVRVDHRHYHKQHQRRQAMSRAMRSLAAHNICQDVPVSSRCVSEIDELIRKPPFSKFYIDMTMESLNYTQAAEVIHEVAPTWYALLQSVLSNRRHHRATYGAQKNDTLVQRRMFTITSIVCFSRARNVSNTFPSCLDVYFYGSGVHRRVVETLHGLGLCHSYHHGNKLQAQVAQHAAVRSLSQPQLNDQ